MCSLGSLYSFVKKSIEGEISKSTPANKCLLDTPVGRSPIRKSIGMFSPVTKANNEKSPRKALKFGQESLQVTEKENSDYFDQFLNIDNIPEGGLQVKVVLKINSGNVLVSFTEAFTEGSRHFRLRPRRK